MIQLLKSIYQKFLNTYPYSDYSFKHKCIFIHIPKAAGTSIIKAFGGNTKKRVHATWREYNYKSNIRFNSYRKFSVVREPISRFVSAYSYLIQGGNQTTDLTYVTYLSQFKGINDFIINGIDNTFIYNSLLFKPQNNFIFNEFNECKVDDIIKIEEIDKLNLYLSDLLENNVEISNYNKSKCAGENLSDTAVNKLKEIYKDDYILLGYKL
ncbi:sulfotransferase family 2 domain-containing protein [Vibrio sp. 10N.222.54.B12]|uniref:sulfotransferase family 2 domain-containing protein n=1 Tax=Vibrio sp. 10N.222.54.B12 TaxID=3229636 RepID=UPI00355073A8